MRSRDVSRLHAAALVLHARTQALAKVAEQGGASPDTKERIRRAAGSSFEAACLLSNVFDDVSALEAERARRR